VAYIGTQSDGNDIDYGYQDTVDTSPEDNSIVDGSSDTSSGTDTDGDSTTDTDTTDDDTGSDDEVPADVNDTDPVDEPDVETVIKISTSEITTSAKWFAYDSDGIEVRYFAVRSNDQEIHIAFDACDVCYKEKMGYRQENIQMVCNNCGNAYPIKGIGTENKGGGCWPSYLPMTIEDDNIVIKTSDLDDNKWMFE